MQIVVSIWHHIPLKMQDPMISNKFLETMVNWGDDHFMYVELQEANALRLSSHQITLLLSSIWAQSISPANMPENYEAIAHTYSLVLLFSRAKVKLVSLLTGQSLSLFNYVYISIRMREFLCYI